MRTFILKLNCPDAVGLLARITGFIAGSGGNLLEVGQYTDPISRHFFTRLAFTGGLAVEDLAAFRAEFARLAGPLSAEWQVRAADEPVRTVVLVSREDHCLADLLWRWRSRELNIDIAGVLSNHANARGLVEREGIAFEHIDFADRAAAFEGLAARLRALRAELVVLARFMQVLPDALCEEYAGRVINIHHSFLPAFVGANPYRRAFERGVKLIGATSHYVTEDLDEGPIIEQDVVRVEHDDTVDDLVRYGKDVEKSVLARALRYHLEDRVLLNGHRTVVFR